jgi:ribosome-associated translation inhibitor RaiA
MKIEFHTDKDARGSKASTDSYVTQVASALGPFSEVITHLDAYLSDEDPAQTGVNTKKCKLETRLENRKPIAVTDQSDTYEKAIDNALDKLTASLNDFG